MELFYSTDIANGLCTLTEEESRHCSKVLRHVPGDMINVIDGEGTLYTCRIIESGKQVVCSIEETLEGFGAHNYHLTMAVCPTKNIDRYEWFLEKATEMGVDVVVPVIGEHSERRIIKPERLEKILVSAAKQSLKGAVPQLRDAVTVKEFLRESATYSGDVHTLGHDTDGVQEALPGAAGVVGGSDVHPDGREATNGQEALPGQKGVSEVKLIAYCGVREKVTLAAAVAQAKEMASGDFPKITVLIGPEGDFSPAEVDVAIAAGYKPLTLGESRLRTETAAVAAVAGVYFMM